MNDDELHDVLRVIERPVPVSDAFTDRVLRAMLDELEAEQAPAASATTLERPRRRRLGRRPTIGIAAAVIIAVLAASLVLTTRSAPSALAAIKEALVRFASLPAYTAQVEVSANEDSGDPDFETRYSTEDMYRDRDTWKTAVATSNAASIGQPGDYQVLAGGLYGVFNADANTFTLTPVAERDQPPMSPADAFDPSFQWWSTGARGDPGRPSDEFFEENCTARDTTYLDRAATALHCPAEPRDIDLVLDEQTGMLLRISVFDIERRVTRIRFDPTFADDSFSTNAPGGARRRWGGTSPPPADYQVALGSEVAARYQVTVGPVDGAQIRAITRTDVWVATSKCSTDGCFDQLHRVNIRTGAVVAVIDPPNRAFIGDVAEIDGELWVAMGERLQDGNTGASFIQRLDASTNSITGDRIETGRGNVGSLVAVGDELWSTGGAARPVSHGRASTTYFALARISLDSREVTQVDIDATPTGAPIFANGAIWVGTDRINTRNVEQPDYGVGVIDPGTNRVVRRISAPNGVGSPAVVGERAFITTAEYAGGRERWLIGAADANAPTFVTNQIAPAGAALGPPVFAAGSLWIPAFGQDTVLKIDPTTLQVTGTVPTGRGPGGVAVAQGSVWVTNGQDGTLVRIDVE